MDVKDRLAEAEQELLKLSGERDILDRRIKGLVQVIEGLRFMAQGNTLSAPPSPLESVEEIGLTDAVRRCLKSAVGPMFPTEIRDKLWSAGYTGPGDPKNPLISVHGILDRLMKKGEVDEVLREEQKAYESVGSLTQAIRKHEKEKFEAIGRLYVRRREGLTPPPSASDDIEKALNNALKKK